MSVRRVTWRGSHEKKMRLNNLHIFTRVILYIWGKIHSFIQSLYLLAHGPRQASFTMQKKIQYRTGQEISKCWFDVSFPFHSFVTQRQKWQIFLIWKLFNGNMILDIYILAEGQLEGGNSCFHTSTPWTSILVASFIYFHIYLNSYLITYSMIRVKCQLSINSTL